MLLRARKIVPRFLVGLMVLFAAGPASAYLLQGGQWPQPGGMGTPITLTYSYQNMFDGSILMPNGQPLPNSIIKQSIEEALSVWAQAIPVNYVQVPDNGLPYGVSGAQYGQIRFRHMYINGPDPIPIPPQIDRDVAIAKAQSYFPFSGDPYAGDVEYDDSDRWQLAGTIPQPDILGATIHELGHTLGLGHTDVVDANMYWIFHRFDGLGKGKLFADDLAGIQLIYGAGKGSVTSLPIPEPATWVMVAIAAGVAAHRRRRRTTQDGSAI